MGQVETKLLKTTAGIFLLAPRQVEGRKASSEKVMNDNRVASAQTSLKNEII